MADEAAFTNVITPVEARSTGLTLAVEILTAAPGPFPAEAEDRLYGTADNFAEYILFGTGRV